MEKNTQGIVAVFAFLSLLVGFSLGAVLMGEDTETIVETEVDKIVNVSVEVPVEIPVADISIYRSQAVEDFLDYVEDEDDMLECGDYDYDSDEITVSRIYDDYSVSIEDEDHTVDFSIRLKYDEEDERSCRQTYDVEAYYEDSEDVEISLK